MGIYCIGGTLLWGYNIDMLIWGIICLYGYIVLILFYYE